MRKSKRLGHRGAFQSHSLVAFIVFVNSDLAILHFLSCWLLFFIRCFIILSYGVHSQVCLIFVLSLPSVILESVVLLSSFPLLFRSYRKLACLSVSDRRSMFDVLFYSFLYYSLYLFILFQIHLSYM